MKDLFKFLFWEPLQENTSIEIYIFACMCVFFIGSQGSSRNLN